MACDKLLFMTSLDPLFGHRRAKILPDRMPLWRAALTSRMALPPGPQLPIPRKPGFMSFSLLATTTFQDTPSSES